MDYLYLKPILLQVINSAITVNIYIRFNKHLIGNKRIVNAINK